MKFSESRLIQSPPVPFLINSMHAVLHSCLLNKLIPTMNKKLPLLLLLGGHLVLGQEGCCAVKEVQGEQNEPVSQALLCISVTVSMQLIAKCMIAKIKNNRWPFLNAAVPLEQKMEQINKSSKSWQPGRGMIL